MHIRYYTNINPVSKCILIMIWIIMFNYGYLYVVAH